ncbi:MAG: HAMP domain-containing histidine kinase [Clostridiales bacterium]|nr:HAMP domain-containing histidine kinase [Clostridiales bacterium]
MYDVQSDLFGSFREAVIAVKNGEIAYFNDTAAKLIPKIETLRPENIFPPQLLNHDSKCIVGEAEIEGIHTVVNVSSLDDCSIYSIIAPGSEEHANTAHLLSAVSTEFKNMLAVLRMASGLLLPYVENTENPRFNRYAAMIYHCYYNMLRLTNNLSDLGGMLKDDVPLLKSSFDIIGACRDLIDSVQHLVSETGVELRFKSNEESLIIYADRVKLDKLLLNLLSNSLSYTPVGGVLTLSVISAGDRFVISVSDSGAGIPSDVMSTAWSRYSAPKTMIDTETGVGLGLTIVRNIARLHNGSAVLESRPGEGTTVTVSIPIEKQETTDFRTSVVNYESYGMHQLLTELSGVISYEKYTQQYMD